MSGRQSERPSLRTWAAPWRPHSLRMLRRVAPRSRDDTSSACTFLVDPHRTTSNCLAKYVHQGTPNFGLERVADKILFRCSGRYCFCFGRIMRSMSSGFLLLFFPLSFVGVSLSVAARRKLPTRSSSAFPVFDAWLLALESCSCLPAARHTYSRKSCSWTEVVAA